MKRIIPFLILFFLLIFPNLSPAASSSPRKQFQKAKECTKTLNSSEAKKRLRQNWEKCVKEFNAIAAKNPKSEYADDGLFNIGNLYTGLYNYSKNLNDLDRAIDAYNKLIKKYPKSPYADDACFEIGEVYLKQKNSLDDALEAYKKVVKLYPKSKIKEELKKEPISVGDGILKRIRVSQHTQKDARVVLDLGSIDDYRFYPLTEPHRLVIDMYGAKYREENETKGKSTKDKEDKGMPLSQQLNLTVKTIVLDPGHGGKDPGAIGKNGLMERDVTLDVAKGLKKILVEKADKKVYLTREDDTYIRLEQRPTIASGKKADLFISIHVNSNTKRSSRGIETYILNLSSDKWAQKTAARENMASEKSISDLEKILFDLADNNKEVSMSLALSVQNSVVNTLKKDYSRIEDLGVKQAPFYVLIGTKVPSILAEVSFISNPDEEKRLRTPEYRQKIAEGLYEGIKRYITTSTPQVALRESDGTQKY